MPSSATSIEQQHRTIAIFDWVVRNISLQPSSDAERVALGLFDVMLTGLAERPRTEHGIFAEASASTEN